MKNFNEKGISRIFQEYFPKCNHKSSQKVGECGSCHPVYTPMNHSCIQKTFTFTLIINEFLW
jgi:hypothetical protein